MAALQFRNSFIAEGNASSEARPRRARSEPPRRAPLADDVLSEKMQEMHLTQWLQQGYMAVLQERSQQIQQINQNLGDGVDAASTVDCESQEEEEEDSTLSEG
ncbi:unnamed protein product [Cladocopium goreaui]|uniref:Uncharacterized protein n=1 Tax=Cladocopium goreaui TaxID=2562237 RepID=A0A9P1BTL7_9DINO|nr:unnamed protein product [Cladocopium goreaui]